MLICVVFTIFLETVSDHMIDVSAMYPVLIIAFTLITGGGGDIWAEGEYKFFISVEIIMLIYANYVNLFN